MKSKKNEYLFKGVLETDKYSYKITISTSQRILDGKQIIYSRYFNIGGYTSDDGEKKTCVDIYVMYPELKKTLPSINYKLAKLITTHYNEKCSIDEKLDRGEGTRHMINTAMYFVSKACPFVEGFEINDASVRNCDNSTIITLSYFSISNYGKTWYEKNFNAYIADTAKYTKYKNTISELFSYNLPEWDEFNAIFMRNINKEIRETLQLLYEDSKTYGDLFKAIHQIGISKACIYLQPWIDKLMMSTDLKNYVLYTQWIIPIESIKRTTLTGYTKEFFGKVENYKNK
jgi:hypothetical protein